MNYAQVTTESELMAHLAAGSCCVAAGMTDLYPSGIMQSQALPVVDITSVPTLHGIRAEPHGYWIGATTRWSDLLDHRWPAGMTLLAEAAAQVGAVQVQNAATVAGNVCNASPAADGVPVLMSLDAEVEIGSSSGVRRLPVSGFVSGVRQTVLGDSEYVRGFVVPQPDPGASSAFLKLGSRAYLVISIAMVAGVLHCDDDGRVVGVKLSLGACSPVAARLSSVEAALQGQTATTALVDKVRAADVERAIRPIDDVRASAAYRSRAAVQLVRDTVALLVERLS
ncbi:MAG: FAD binding domain-containing protein [Pseudomonadota bacterium]